MKNKAIITLSCAIIIIFGVILILNSVVSEIEESSSSEESSEVESEESSKLESSEVSLESSSEESSNSDVDEDPENPQEIELPWNLILVNLENALPDDYEFEIADYDGIEVDERIYDAISQLLADARSQGMNLWLASGYRSVELQQYLYDNSVNSYISKGYSEEEAKALTEDTIAIPGHSEHHTGLCVDFNYVSYDFEYTDEFEWLQEHAAEYGFILRYAEDKVDITGYDYEPWHYRYVGVEAAEFMVENNLTLEEYVDYLNEVGIV